MVKYIADSACDLKDFPDICFETVPLTLSTDSRTIVDSPDLDIHETLDYFYGHHGRSYTACPSTQAWIDSFEGADEIYVVTITSGLSGTWNSANVARKQYQSEHPDVKIYVVDSLSTGPGEVLLLEKIVELKKLGKSFEEVCEEIERYKDTLRLYFGLRSLHNLAQNGRVSKIVASAIGFMNIRILGKNWSKPLCPRSGKPATRAEKSASAMWKAHSLPRRSKTSCAVSTARSI